MKKFITSSVAPIPWKLSRRTLSYGFKSFEDIPEHLRPFTEGRGRQERLDSLTLNILENRRKHFEQIQSIPINEDLIEKLEESGFGQKKRLTGLYQGISEVFEDFETETGAGGKAQLLGSFNLELPLFDHLLPEIAMLGHSNAGKSTLINALIGVLPRSGPAGVSERAGWTNHCYYYRLGKRPPILTLVDFPGYGFAVAQDHQQKLWKRMTMNYIKHRSIMTKCCLLIDCQQGLGREDRQLLKLITKIQVPWVIVLTKADLLSSQDLVRTIYHLKKELLAFHLPELRQQINTAKFEDLLQDKECRKYLRFNYGHINENIWPVSASTGAGIPFFWKTIKKWVDRDATPFVGETNVREHKQAAKLRLDSMKHQSTILQSSPIKVSNRELKQLKR